MVGGMNLSNYTKQEKDCRYFWESTLYAPMILPTFTPAEQLEREYAGIVAEREDILSLKLAGDSEKTIYMHPHAWMRSLDYLLYRYLTLVLYDSHDFHYSSTICVPVEIREKYQKYRHAWKKRQHKDHEFILPDYYIKPHNGSLVTSDTDGKYEYFKTDNPVAPAILNVFCHGLFPRAKKNNKQRDPHVNAQLYQLNSCGLDTIPSFKPEDYIAYELLTGLSLSIEITAILLEIDQEIRDLALDYFCKYAIMDLVRIPFPYARSTAARNFFIQVNLEWTKTKYHWSPTSSTSMAAAIETAAYLANSDIQTLSKSFLCPEISQLRPYDIIYEKGADPETILHIMENNRDLNLSHVVEALRNAGNDPTYGEKYRIYMNSSKPGYYEIKSFMFPRYPISFPITDDLAEIERYKTQILGNLKVVTSPLDWKKLFEPKPKNLAVFTNPKHKFVSMLMEYVETGHLQSRSQKDPPPIKSKECIDLLRLVYSVIRSASIEVHKDIYKIKRFLKQMEPPLI